MKVFTPVILILTFIWSFTIFKSKKISPPLFALFGMGLAKWGLSFLPADFDLTTWHNFPALVWGLGVLFFQMDCINFANTKNEIAIKWATYLAPLTIVVYLAISTLNSSTHPLQDSYPLQEVEDFRKELNLLKKHLPSAEVVSIEPKFAFEFINYRFAFFPRGVTWEPQGIATSVIVKKTNGQKMGISPCFALTQESEHFEFYRRLERCQTLDQRKDRFIQLFGKGSVQTAL